jgi:hypothetical protein
MFALRRSFGNAHLERVPGAPFFALAFLGVGSKGFFSSDPKLSIIEDDIAVENRDLRNSKPCQT